jgi:hypothetical protein
MRKKMIARLSHGVVKKQRKECGRKRGFHSLTFHPLVIIGVQLKDGLLHFQNWQYWWL